MDARSKLAQKIKVHLWENDDLLKDPNDIWPLEHPLAGQCYVASEVLFHMTGGYDEWKVERVTVEVPEPGPIDAYTEFTHWYLRDRDTGEVMDITASQFTEYKHATVKIPYDKGTATGFMTEEPSQRAQSILARVDTDKPKTGVPTVV